MKMCICGCLATTEIQCGWDPNANGGVGGGVYESVCEACYSKTDEAMAHLRQHAEMVQDVHYGRYARTIAHGHVRWVGPDGWFDDAEYHRLLRDPYGIHDPGKN
jgi:hypothetical protein